MITKLAALKFGSFFSAPWKIVGSVRFGLFRFFHRFFFPVRFGSVFLNFGSLVRFGSVRSFLEIGSVRFFFRFGSVFSAPRKIVGSNRFGFFVGFFSVRFGSTTYDSCLSK